jgi:WD40 repeat protein
MLKKLEGHSNVVGALAVSNDGRVLASGSHDKTVRLWILPQGEPWGTLEAHSAAVTCLASDPESRILVSGSHDCAVMMWNFQSGIFRRPVTRPDLDRVETFLAGRVDKNERAWLEFLLAQMRRRWRFDIEIDTKPTRIEVGEFDIEVLE